MADTHHTYAGTSSQPDTIYQVKKILYIIIRRWYWIISALVVALLAAFLINRYTNPIFVVNASFVNKKYEDESKSVLSELVQGGGNSYFNKPTNFEQEVIIIKSPKNIGEVIDGLNFNVGYYVEGRLRTQEIFRNPNYDLEIDWEASQSIPFNTRVYINRLNDKEYSLALPESPSVNEGFAGKTFVFGKVYHENGLKFRVTNPGGNGLAKSYYQFYFIVKSDDALIKEYSQKLRVHRSATSIFEFKIQSKVPEKDQKFLAEFLEVVKKNQLESKNTNASNTINFIDKQLSSISDSLTRYQNKIDAFYMENQFIDDGSKYVFNKINELEQKKAQLKITNNYLDYIESYIKEKKRGDVFAPNMLGLELPLFSQLINKYIEQKLTTKRLRNERNSDNPLITRANDELEKLEATIFENIRSTRSYNQKKLDEIEDNISFLYNSIDGVQEENRKLERWKRVYSINEEILNLLLEKKTEASIAKASTTSDYEILDEPAVISKPIVPKTESNYRNALLFGLAIPIGIIYLIFLLRDRIVDKNDIKGKTTIPIAASVGHSTTSERLKFRLRKPRPGISEEDEKEQPVLESFRRLRSNLHFFINEKPVEQTCTTFLITSSVAGEGKSFCSLNLAKILAFAGRKTILVSTDMRKPGHFRAIGASDRHEGLSQYLVGYAERNDIIQDTTINNLDIIKTGQLPPNPSELLLSSRMKTLMDFLKTHYDYIVLDSPPIGIISDGIELLKYADLTLFVFRQNFSKNESIRNLNEMQNERNIRNLAIIFNDVKISLSDSRYGYGYRNYHYYYGYAQGKKNFWKRLFNA